ncbi:MAG TPA: hypothetical protein ENI86_13455 [Acidimicrobiales bacterium]|nr:hypothetical protein [Acidimicrobiales bacterium]
MKWTTAQQRIIGLGLALALLAAACGGSGGSSADSAEDAGGSQDAGSASTAETASATAPVEGLVVVLNSFGDSLFEVNPSTGEHRALTMDGAEFVDRQNQPVVAGGRAWMITGTLLEGQSYSSTVGLGRLDLATGEGRQIAELGVDRENDEAQDLNIYEIVGADDTSVWVKVQKFGEDSSQSIYRRYDAETGDLLGEIDELVYEYESDTATCTAGITEPRILPDGTFMALVGTFPAVVDTETGEITPTVPWCEANDDAFDPYRLSSVLTPEEMADWAITESGEPVPAEELDSMFGFGDITPSGGKWVIDGDRHAWWVFAGIRGYRDGEDSGKAIIGGVVEFDLDSNQLVEIYPLGEYAGRWLPDDDTFDVATLSDVYLAYSGDRLWIMDGTEDGPLIGLDPATGTVEAHQLVKGEGVDVTEAEILAFDADGLWLEVNRAVVTENEDGSRSRLGELSLVRIQGTTGAVVVDVPEREILS